MLGLRSPVAHLDLFPCWGNLMVTNHDVDECVHPLQVTLTELLISAGSGLWGTTGGSGVDTYGLRRRTGSPVQEKGGGLEEDRRWLASWITSAGQSGNGSTWGRGGTQWLLSLLEFWLVGLKRERERKNEWGRQQKYNKSYSLTVWVYVEEGATEDLSFLKSNSLKEG